MSDLVQPRGRGRARDWSVGSEEGWAALQTEAFLGGPKPGMPVSEFADAWGVWRRGEVLELDRPRGVFKVLWENDPSMGIGTRWYSLHEWRPNSIFVRRVDR